MPQTRTPAECPHCGKQFTHKYNMRKHAWHQHRDEAFHNWSANQAEPTAQNNGWTEEELERLRALYRRPTAQNDTFSGISATPSHANNEQQINQVNA